MQLRLVSRCLNLAMKPNYSGNIASQHTDASGKSATEFLLLSSGNWFWPTTFASRARILVHRGPVTEKSLRKILYP